MILISKYLIAVMNYWQALVTGGVLVALLGVWQAFDHKVENWIYLAIAGLAIFVAGFQAWMEQFKLNRALCDGFPRIVLAENPIEVAPFAVQVPVSHPNVLPGGMRVQIATYTALRLRIGNKPEVNTPSASSRINAKISFYNDAGSRLAILDGRFADTPQETERDRTKDYVESLSVGFPVGAERSLDIAFKRPGEMIAVAFNNDNFSFANLGPPGRDLAGVVNVIVDLNGTYVKTKIKFQMSCNPLGLVGTVSIEDSTPR